MLDLWMIIWLSAKTNIMKNGVVLDLQIDAREKLKAML